MRPERKPSSEELRERFGRNLREYRGRARISQHELALRAEISLPAISLFELGRSLPRTDTFLRLAGTLGVSPSELVEGIQWMPAETVMTPGAFEVPEDPDLAAAVAELRGSAPGRRRQ